MAVHLDAAMDGYVGVVISMPAVAMLMGSAAVFVCPNGSVGSVGSVGVADGLRRISGPQLVQQLFLVFLGSLK
jgi:hypothetical protein